MIKRMSLLFLLTSALFGSRGKTNQKRVLRTHISKDNDNATGNASSFLDETESYDLTLNTTAKRSLGYLLYTAGSQTPLLAGEEYNSGPIDIAEFSLISVIITGTPDTATGVLYLEFSPDATNWDRSVAIPVEDLMSEPPHTSLPVSVFFRVRYVNGPVDQNTMRLQVVFHRNSSKGLTSRLEQTIKGSSDVENVRAVIVGRTPDGTYLNTKQDGSAFRTTNNLAGTTLSAGLASGLTGAQTVFTNVSNFPTSGYIYVDSEFIGYSANNLTDTLTITERGALGTTDASHSSGATVGQAYTTGILTLDGYTEVATKINCSNTGRMRFQWYSDPAGTNNIRTLSPPYTDVSVYDFLAAPNFGPYIRYTFANTQPFDTTNFYFETEFYTKSISAQVLTLNSPMADGMTSNLTRSIIVGKNETGKFENVRITSEDALAVDVKGASSAFGEIGVSEPTTVSQIQFTYGFNPALMTRYLNNGGSMAAQNSMINLSSGTNQNSMAKLQSNLPIRYNPGEGAFCRFSAVFDTGTVGSTQYAGVGDESNGLFFGYKDNVFGVIRRTGGSPEVRTLTLTEKADQDQDIDIVLDGDTKTISVTAADDITETANEIAAADYSQTGSGWRAQASGNSVIFIAWDASQRDGIYQITSDESSSNKIEGTFTRTITGRNPQENFVPQSEWNVDPYDGTGITGISINPLKGNIFQIRWQWLGFGAIGFFLENPDTGSIERVHTIQYCNKNTTPSVWDPNLRLHYSVKNTTNTNPINLYSGSIAGFVDGKDLPFGTRGGVRGDANVRNAEVPIITLRNALIYNGKNNNSRARVNLVLASSNHSEPVEIIFYANAQLIKSSFKSVSNISFMEYDTSATSCQKGIYLGSMYVEPKGSSVINLTADPTAGMLAPGSQFTIAARSIGKNRSGKVYANFNFLEFK